MTATHQQGDNHLSKGTKSIVIRRPGAEPQGSVIPARTVRVRRPGAETKTILTSALPNDLSELKFPSSFDAPKQQNKAIKFSLRLLSSLLEDKISLSDSLCIISKINRNEAVKSAFKLIHHSVATDPSIGSNLTKAMFDTGVFNRTHINIIQNNYEKHGDMPKAIKTLIDYYLDRPTNEIGAFTFDLSVLINSGAPLVTALNRLKIDSPKKVKELIADLLLKVDTRRTFHQALEAFPQTFSPAYIDLVKLGEATGTLSKRLADIAKAYKNKERK